MAVITDGRTSLDISGVGLPDQTGHSGDFLTTDGETSSWAELAGGGDMARATYDTNADNIVDKAASVDDGTNVKTAAQIKTHIDSTSNPHSVTKTQVGLGNADNTSDANKPVSTAQQTALNAKADLVGGIVPSNQLPAALVGAVNYQNVWDAGGGTYPLNAAKGDYYIINGAGTIDAVVYAVGDWIVYNGSSWDKVNNANTVSSVNTYTGAVVLVKADVGLGNVANLDQTNPANITQDATHRFATDTEKNTWNTMVPNTTTVNSQALSANVTLTATDVGLSNVTNEAQIAKSIGTTKGDLITFSGSATPVRLQAGSNGQMLYADSNEAGGLKWDAAPTGTGNFNVPGASTDNAVVRFDGAGGQTGQNSVMTVSDTGTVNIPTGQTYNINGTPLAKGDVGLGNVTNEAQIAKSIGVAKGDLISFTGSGAPVRVAVGSNNQFMVADSTQASGHLYRGILVADVPTLNQNTTGNATTASALATARAINGVNFDGSAPVTVPVNNANDATTNATMYPLWTPTQGGNYAAKTSNNLTYNPSTGTLTAAGFSGPLTGNVTGNVSGNAGNLTGTPTLPNGTAAATQTAGDNTTKLATTAFVTTAVGAGTGTSNYLLMSNKPTYNVGDVAIGNTLADAVTNIGSTVCTLVISKGSSQAGGGVTIPATMNLKVEKGGTITLANGTTMTVNGSIEAGPYQIFSRTGTGTVAWGAYSKNDYALVNWYGATGDGVTNDTAAFQWAIDSVINTGAAAPVTELHGLPGCTYRVGELVVNPTGWGSDTYGNIDMRGATLKINAVTDTYLMKFMGNYAGNSAFRNAKLVGFVDVWVSSDTVNSAAAVTIGGNSATLRGSLQLLDNPGANYWYWYDSGGKVLYVACPLAAGHSYPGATIGYNDAPNVVADAVSVGNWTRYQPNNGVWHSDTAAVSIENVQFMYFNIGLKLDGIQWSNFERLLFWACDQAAFINSAGGSANNIQQNWRKLYLRYIWGFNNTGSIQVVNCSAVHMDGIDHEACRAKLLQMDGGNTLNIKGAYSEGPCCFLDSTDLELINIAVCQSVEISNSSLGLGGNTLDPSCTTMFRFGSGVSGATIRNCALTADGDTNKPTLYEMNVAASGVVFRENNYFLSYDWTRGQGGAVIEGVATDQANQSVNMNIETIRPATPLFTDYSNFYSFAGASTSGAVNCTATIDAGTQFISGHSSLKLEFTGAGHVSVTDPFTGAASSYCLVSVFFMSDVAMRFYVNVTGGPQSLWTYSPGDSVWRILYWYTTSASICSGLTIYGDADHTGKYLWLDGLSLKTFPTRNEQMANVGRFYHA